MQNNQVQIFNHQEFGRVRVIQKDGQPWFVGKDVADALGYSNSSKAVSNHVDEEDRLAEMVPTAQNGKLLSRTFIINESGLYSLILASKLPTAKMFKRWVTSEVLPSIRRHGAYITSDTLGHMREDSAFTEELLHRLTVEHAKNGALLDYVDELQPKAQYHDTVLLDPYAVPVTLIAKHYGMTAIAFNRLLHELGLQHKAGKSWALHAELASEGYTVSETYCVDGEPMPHHTKWTQRGRTFLYERLAQDGILPNAQTCMDMGA